ncbi:MAG TPA: phosphotransferase, partial [Pirellulaceae bacterium]|nr:phosphotransferase [Pirellulaceae bacterium]
MTDSRAFENVLSHYPDLSVLEAEPLGGAGGFSGAAFWKIETGGSQLCLRRWPREHPTRTQLQMIHDVLRHVSQNGFDKLPVPFQTRQGQTIVSVAGHFWELTDWLPGKADFHASPTSERLEAAMLSLAQFHFGAEALAIHPGSPPGIAKRREQLERLRMSGTRELLQAITTVGSQDFRWRAAMILNNFEQGAAKTQSRLAIATRVRVSRQPCIRDIWHDHVLFEGNEVSGIIDFGALQTDHVACDISRLLGSLVCGDREAWERGLTAYQSVRPLTDDELMLVEAYDQSTVLLSGMNWIQWIAVERRTFEDEKRIHERM